MKMTNVITKSYVNVEVSERTHFPLISNFLSDVSFLYPNFDSWLNFKVRRNIITCERQIVIAHDGNEIMGVAILKNTSLEKKISTFYVAPTYRCFGLGHMLMDKSLELLDSYNVFITVSEERNNELRPLLKSKGFEFDRSIPDLYRAGSTEFFYSVK